MKFSRRTAFTSLALAIVLVAGVLLIKLRAAQEDTSSPPISASAITPAVAESTPAKQSTTAADSKRQPPSPSSAGKKRTPPTDPQFAVPEGSNTKKLDFLDKLSQPATQFKSAAEADKYWSQAALSMIIGGEQILNAKPTAAEASQAAQFKIEGLRVLAMIGDKDADRERTEFLNECLKDPRTEVSSVVAPMRMLPKMRRWFELDPAQKTAATDAFISDVKAAGPTPGQGQMLVGFADSLADEKPLDIQLASRAVDQLLPAFQKSFGGSKDAGLEDLVATIAGLSRRLHLPGSKFELEGTFLNGKPVDWESYRGKVVLIDYWASNCPICLQEVPHIKELYNAYHDKGFEIIGLSMDNDRKVTEYYVQKTGMTWPQVFTDTPLAGGWKHPMQLKYAVLGFPRAILVDQQGNVVTTLARGPFLEAYLEKLLGPANDSTAPAGRTSAAPQSPESTSR
jgi:thiol-disulfide isomerase/thioredoxin